MSFRNNEATESNSLDSGSPPAVLDSDFPAVSDPVVPTPIKVQESSMSERHRLVFNQRMFPDLFEDGRLKDVSNHPATSPFSMDMSQSEWQETVDIVLNFGPSNRALATEEQIRFRDSLPKETVRKWIRKTDKIPLIERYKVTEKKRRGSDEIRYELLRLHQRSPWQEEKWLICVPQLEVFSAIRECHLMVHHMKQNQTCTKVHGKYYNITEKQVSMFVETCEVCNMRNPLKKQLKGAAKPILSQNFRDRYQVD